MKVIVFIDTTNNKEVTIGLNIDGKNHSEKMPLDTRKAQVALPMLEKMLEEQGLQLKNITGIEVNPGPGSFTGIRVGLSIANTLGFLLNIPVNGNKIGEYASAEYS
jgi:tRNA threonylcarbamoyladenosine biosynthesis protein TsaB